MTDSEDFRAPTILLRHLGRVYRQTLREPGQRRRFQAGTGSPSFGNIDGDDLSFGKFAKVAFIADGSCQPAESVEVGAAKISASFAKRGTIRVRKSRRPPDDTETSFPLAEDVAIIKHCGREMFFFCFKRVEMLWEEER